MTFAIGDRVRYKPGYGTYGYEDALEADGRLPGIVIGLTPARVRVELTLTKRRGSTVVRSVEASSLVPVPHGTSDSVGAVGVSDPVEP